MTVFPLPAADPADHGIRGEPIEQLAALIAQHIADGRYPGAQIALARHGKLLIDRAFGMARTGDTPMAANADTLWLLYSNTKVIIATALWKLAEQGAFRFTDRLSDHVREFARLGKRDITVLQIITHQGGFPNARLTREAWAERSLMRHSVCEFTLEWTPGSRVRYHPLAAHWALATLIEALTGQDYRDYVRDVILTPLGLAGDLFIGLPEHEDHRVADMYEPQATGVGMCPLTENNNAAWRRAGAPGGGAYGTARGMAALYQMMLNGGELNGVRLLSPRTLAYALHNHTGDRIDTYMGMPMHRGLGPHLRGHAASVRGLGAIASPGTFGHGGIGTSYCWGDPESGVSFAYISNNRIPDPWHSDRLDRISTLVHSAIL